MTTITRSCKLFRFEIRGLPNGVQWIPEILRCFKAVPRTPLLYSTKYHVLHEARVRNEQLCFIFVSYALGDRPDVINTDNMEVEPSPLDKSQANVTYTHAVAWQGKETPLVLLEMINSGIGAGAFSVCMSNLLTHCKKRDKPDSKQLVRTYLTPVSGEEDFFARLKSFDRITSFSMKFPRHENPGISPAINNLDVQMNASKAGSVEIIARPMTNETLPTNIGIIPHGKKLKEEDEIEYFKADGTKNKRSEHLNSKKMDEKYLVTTPTVDGRVRSSDMFAKLASLVEEVFF